MAEPALKFENARPVSEAPAPTAVVLEAGAGRFLVTDGRGEAVPAGAAASCLLRPEPGDEVAVLRTEDGRIFITAVLTRPSADSPVIDLPRGATFACGGRTDFVGGEELAFTAPRLSVTADEAELKVVRLNFIGRAVQALADNWNVFGRAMFAGFERLSQRLGSSSRLVAGHDETQAETVRQLARKNHVTQAEQVVVTASETVRVDGEQINLA